jgi:predicted RNase H-like HicB family nuclease
MDLPTQSLSAYIVGDMSPDSGSQQFRARFLKRERWWIAWTADVPGALTQGRSLEEARENLRDAIRLMLEPVSPEQMPVPSGRLVEETIVL